jgi:hypothetical protein
MSFESEHEQYDDEWAEEDLVSPGGSLLPDGSHQVIVRESRIEEPDWGWQFVLKFGNNDGVITKWQNLDNDVGRKIALTDARMLGYEGPLSGLRAACESGQFLDKLCEINIKTTAGDTRDFKNIYLNRVLGVVEARTPLTTESSDDIPF